jgi:hypothetical protein
MDCHSGRGDATSTSADASAEPKERGDASERGDATSATDSSQLAQDAGFSRAPTEVAKVSSKDGTPDAEDDFSPPEDVAPEEVEGVSESFGPAARLFDRRSAAIWIRASSRHHCGSASDGQRELDLRKDASERCEHARASSGGDNIGSESSFTGGRSTLLSSKSDACSRNSGIESPEGPLLRMAGCANCEP